MAFWKALLYFAFSPSNSLPIQFAEIFPLKNLMEKELKFKNLDMSHLCMQTQTNFSLVT